MAAFELLFILWLIVFGPIMAVETYEYVVLSFRTEWPIFKKIFTDFWKTATRTNLQ